MSISRVNVTRLCLAAASVGLALLGSGCANYGVLDVRMQTPPDPTEGPAVSLVRITDRREFRRPRFSLTDPTMRARDLENTALRARVVSWRPSRHPFQGNGNHVLPEGRTVEDVVREAMTRSFRESGYRVVAPADAARAGATPVEADIGKFYCGLRNLIGTFSLLFDCEVKITGNVPPFEEGKTVLGHVALHSQAVGPKRPWMNTINKGLDDFVQEMNKALAGASARTQAAPPTADASARLKQLEQMRNDKLITDDEYQRKRQAILDGL